MTLAEIDQTLIELERRGLVEKTGQLRDGWPIWRRTARAYSLEDTVPKGEVAFIANPGCRKTNL